MAFFTDLLTRYSGVAGPQASIGVTLTAAVLLVAFDWRLSIAALAVQYMLAVLLFAQVLPPEVAMVKAVVGLISTVILLLSALQADSLARRRSIGPQGRAPSLLIVRGSIMPAGVPFRLLAAATVGLAVWATAGRQQSTLPEVSSDVALAVFALAAMSLLVVALTEAPLQIGFGLLTLLTGFELFYHAVEPSLSVIALLAVAHFGIALVTGYLTIVEATK
jgi:hypothetical protein